MAPLHTRLACAFTALTFVACGGPPSVPDAPPTVPAAPAVSPTPSAAPSAAPADIGPRPALTAAPTFTPPVPTVLKRPGLPTVWLLERHTMPLVAVAVVAPAGAAEDPRDRAGLAALTAEMMEQGAGRYGALEISRLFDRLGATASVDAQTDGAVATLTVLKPNLKRALELLGDVVSRPRFEAAEWKRTHALWLDQLQQRPFEPGDVAALVARAVHFGPKHPYGTPVDGLVETVKRLDLAQVKAFHQARWRPDRATLVVVGDVTPQELDTLFAPAFSNWVTPKAAAPAPVTAPAPHGPWARTVMVDRPDAPQTMFMLIAPGPPAADVAQPALQLANIPFGVSFTSRLNANLREDKGYTYGARSSVAQDRLAGRWVIRTAVERSVTAPALKEILKEVGRLAEGGLQPDELQKARATARGDLVSGYQSVEQMASRLAELAGSGLPPDWDRTSAQAEEALTDPQIVKAATSTSLIGATIVAVGDGKTILEAFAAAGLPAPERRDAEGRAVAASKGGAK